MQTEESELSFAFLKSTTWEAVRASGIGLIAPPPAEVAHLPLRVICALRLAENHEGAPCVRIDYFVEALWSASGGEPEWNDITSRSLRLEDDETARTLFAETEEEACTIDAAIEKLLGPIQRAARVRRGTPETVGGGP